MPHSTDLLLRKILADVLGLKPGQADGFTAETGLFGATVLHLLGLISARDGDERDFV